MKIYQNMIEINPNEKTTPAGQKLLEEHGGLAYKWMGNKLFIKSNSQVMTQKIQYKNHPNGRGIEVWECRQCHCMMDDIAVKSSRKTICDTCKLENKKLRLKIKRMEKLVCIS